MKKLVAVLALMLFASCSTFTSVVDKAFVTNKIAHSKVVSYFSVECMKAAMDCKTAENKECPEAHKCLKAFKHTTKLSISIDTALIAAQRASMIVEGEKEAMIHLQRALALALELNRIIKDMELHKWKD